MTTTDLTRIRTTRCVQMRDGVLGSDSLLVAHLESKTMLLSRRHGTANMVTRQPCSIAISTRMWCWRMQRMRAVQWCQAPAPAIPSGAMLENGHRIVHPNRIAATNRRVLHLRYADDAPQMIATTYAPHMLTSRITRVELLRRAQSQCRASWSKQSLVAKASQMVHTHHPLPHTAAGNPPSDYAPVPQHRGAWKDPVAARNTRVPALHLRMEARPPA